ncbi:hypothetical protein I7I51_02573 [Histoplasma capsulatum]|uniref:Uncharacterized protein n=1 Tax=Ajellomyces capsulatus TaxID=5037 RepID=A0A8A1MCA0_AJECA|nr:hypothetical protein I7I51_02573 [Histoplasma capsulatum]
MPSNPCTPSSRIYSPSLEHFIYLNTLLVTDILYATPGGTSPVYTCRPLHSVLTLLIRAGMLAVGISELDLDLDLDKWCFVSSPRDGTFQVAAFDGGTRTTLRTRSSWIAVQPASQPAPPPALPLARIEILKFPRPASMHQLRAFDVKRVEEQFKMVAGSWDEGSTPVLIIRGVRRVGEKSSQALELKYIPLFTRAGKKNNFSESSPGLQVCISTMIYHYYDYDWSLSLSRRGFQRIHVPCSAGIDHDLLRSTLFSSNPRNCSPCRCKPYTRRSRI